MIELGIFGLGEKVNRGNRPTPQHWEKSTGLLKTFGN
jgi:hypothetical protein